MKRFAHLLIPTAITLIFASQTADAKPRAISIDSGMTETIVGVPNSTVMTMFISSSSGADADYIALGGPSTTINDLPAPAAPIFCTQFIGGTCAGATVPGTTANLGKTTATGELPTGTILSSTVQFVLVDTTTSSLFASGYTIESLDPAYGSGTGLVFQDWVTSNYSDFGFGVLPASASALSGLPASAHLQFVGWDNTISCPDPEVSCNGDDPTGVDTYQYDDVVMAVWFVPDVATPEPLTLALFGAGLIGIFVIGRRYMARVII